ncbi:MAG: hypothetical protein KAQ97_10695 [Candidatus Fermentibacteraceae bacterium]|nr:hypothetical protein [Candidatus Fermentibacteraceae bacterium]
MLIKECFLSNRIWSKTEMFLILSTLLLLFSHSAFSGPAEILWEIEIPSEFNSCICGVDFTDDGGAICVGEIGSEDNEITSLFLLKLQPDGAIQWEETTGWGLATSGQDVLQISGGYVVCGSIFSGTDYNGFVAKFDYFGNVLWCREIHNINDDALYDISETADGGFVAAGYTKSTGAGGKDFWLVRVDASGNLEWTRTFGTAMSDAAYSVVALANGGFALGGGSAGNFYIVITDSSGVGVNAFSFNNEGHETARCLKESSEGGFLLAGSTMQPGNYESDIWLVRLDTSGNMIWSLVIEGDDNDSAWDIVEPETGGFIVLANTMSSGRASYDAILYRLDYQGNIIWEMNAGNAFWNTGCGLAINPEGNLLFGGRTLTDASECFLPWIVYTTPEDLLNW